MRRSGDWSGRDRLAHLRGRIEQETPFVGIKPYSHNIIGIVLNQIASEFGLDEANRAIDDFGLEELGWRKVENRH